MRVCANPNCDEPSMTVNPSLRCVNCESYRKSHDGEERPLRLIRWPAQGHPLLPTVALTKLTGITYRRIDHAVRTGWLVPTVEGNGSGTSRGFTFDDAVRAVVGFECTGFVDKHREYAVLACASVTRLRLRAGKFSELVIDVDAIREHLREQWPAEYAMDLDDEARGIVLGQAVAA